MYPARRPEQKACKKQRKENRNAYTELEGEVFHAFTFPPTFHNAVIRFSMNSRGK